MSTGTIPACASGLTATTLSAWRDGALNAGEMERVRAHVAGCAPCQGRLAEYEAIAGVLHEQRVSAPDERLWRAVRAEMAGRASRRGFPLPFTTSGAWRSVAAVAAVLLLVVGFATVFRLRSTGRVVATRTPTATLAPPALSWHPTLNQGVAMPYGQTPAPSDGNTAYMCMGGAGAPGQQLTVWVTHDQAAHWTRTQDLPASGHTAGSTTQCLLAVDATDALRVAVTVYWQDGRQGPTPQETSSFITTDGGVTWQALPGPQSFTIAAMATYQGVTYAIRTTISDVTSRAVDYLWASSDGLRTWRPVDQVLAAADQQVRSFWINQGSGEILAAATSTNPTNPSDTASLWDTHDGGRTWKQLPGASLAMGTILAQTASAAGQPWHICDLYEATSSSSGYRNYLLCSTDGGVTWSMRPAINYTYSCSKCGVPGTPTTEAWPMTLVAIADDGALLATEDVPTGPFTVPGANNSQPTNTLFRLPLGGSAWQSLGAVPSTYGNVVYSGSPGQGVLWSIGEGTTTFTAAYP